MCVRLSGGASPRGKRLNVTRQSHPTIAVTTAASEVNVHPHIVEIFPFFSPSPLSLIVHLSRCQNCASLCYRFLTWLIAFRGHPPLAWLIWTHRQSTKPHYQNQISKKTSQVLRVCGGGVGGFGWWGGGREGQYLTSAPTPLLSIRVVLPANETKIITAIKGVTGHSCHSRPHSSSQTGAWLDRTGQLAVNLRDAQWNRT